MNVKRPGERGQGPEYLSSTLTYGQCSQQENFEQGGTYYLHWEWKMSYLF